jgi:hypothetical protein
MSSLEKLCRGPLVAAALLLLAAPAARAELRETAIVSGTNCQDSGESGGELFYDSNGVGNRGFTPASVVCAVPFNMPFSGQMYVQLGASGANCATNTSYRPWVDVYDRHAWYDVVCTLSVLSPNGSVQTWFSTPSTSGTQTGYQRLYFNAEGYSLTMGRSLVVACNLPPVDKDFSYISAIGVPFCQVTP